MYKNSIRIFSDASLRNGKIGIGYCLKQWVHGGVNVMEIGREVIEKDIGSHEAEYEALIVAIANAKKYNSNNAELHCDCSSVVDSLNRRRQIKSHVEYVEMVYKLMESYDNWRAFTAPRVANQIAHEQSRIASSQDNIDGE